ncbi:hypothetical protein WKW79_35305 [Variovorax robiniae]|uniref:Uncharacterized protein n=1 Tax=Variovorax robiniae TaxID=1836199 RepID=A0ABU8XJ08_9BURK
MGTGPGHPVEDADREILAEGFDLRVLRRARDAGFEVDPRYAVVDVEDGRRRLPAHGGVHLTWSARKKDQHERMLKALLLLLGPLTTTGLVFAFGWPIIPVVLGLSAITLMSSEEGIPERPRWRTTASLATVPLAKSPDAR